PSASSQDLHSFPTRRSSDLEDSGGPTPGHTADHHLRDAAARAADAGRLAAPDAIRERARGEAGDGPQRCVISCSPVVRGFIPALLRRREGSAGRRAGERRGRHGDLAGWGVRTVPCAGWSPGGAFPLFTTADALIVADPQGVSQATLPPGDATWSTQDAILVGTDTALYQVRSDGTGGNQISNGTYHSPIWAPNATSFTFLRANALWVAAAPALPPEPTALDEGGRVVASFMDARLEGQSSEATRLLDDNGKKAYGDDALHLLPTGDPRFSRYYVLTQELVGN